MRSSAHLDGVTPYHRDQVTRTSRLERLIDRLVAQRGCLGYAATLVRDLPGPILEVGLGKGRTYDYLRTLFPHREIFAFDRSVHATEDCIPDPDHLVLGEFRRTLPAALRLIGSPAALVHADIGTVDPSIDRALVRDIGEALATLVRPGGLIVSDRAIPFAGATRLPTPPSAGQWPYHIRRLP